MTTLEAIKVVLSTTDRKRFDCSTADGEFYLEMRCAQLRCLVRGQQGGWCLSPIPIRNDWEETYK